MAILEPPVFTRLVDQQEQPLLIGKFLRLTTELGLPGCQYRITAWGYLPSLVGDTYRMLGENKWTLGWPVTARAGGLRGDFLAPSGLIPPDVSPAMGYVMRLYDTTRNNKKPAEP